MNKLVAVEYKHNEHNTMMIDWYIGKRCNFSCSYCADFIHDNYSAHVPFEKMKIFVDKIVERYGTNIHWSLTGGEPTLNPHFIQLLEYLQDKKYHISVCTNGSRSIDYLIKMYKLVDNVTYSMHFEHITPKLDEYKEKAIILENWRKEWNKNHVTGWDLGEIQPKQFIARFMVLPGFNEEIYNLTQYFKSQDVERIEHRVIRPQKEYFLEENKEKMPDGSYRWKIKTQKQEISAETKVSPNQDNTDDFTTVLEREERWYSEEDRKTLVEMYNDVKPERKWLRGYIEKENGEITTEDYHYNSLNYEYKTNFKGWTCYAGVTLLKVAPNGDIFVANCFQGGPLANIYTLDDSVQLPKEPIICQKERCTDPMDLRQKKYLNNEYKYLVDTNTDTLCVAPQVNVFVSDITNKFAPCCAFDNSKNTNNFKTITEYLESDFLKEIKTDLSNNQWPSGCDHCKNRKELNLNTDADHYKKIVKDNNLDLTKIEKPILLDIRPGNKCNLKCRMCFPSGSNLIEEEFNQNESMQQYRESLSSDNSNFDDIINYVKENKIHTLKILGGEPTIDEKVAKLLDNITKDNHIEVLKFTTNATNLNSKFQKHFLKFSHVNITFSLDAVGKTYEYIRTNSNFSKVEKNIYNTMTKFPQYSYSFNVVLTPYNIFNLVDLVKWFIDLKQKHRKFGVHFSHSVASYTHLSAVPSPYVRSTATELKSLQKLYPNFYKIKDLIVLLESVKFKKENFTKFSEYSRQLDKIRKTSVVEIDERFIFLR
jgi:MoaA/NifB/PqqE/SkfB family radical SAM enzyme